MRKALCDIRTGPFLFALVGLLIPYEYYGI